MRMRIKAVYKEGVGLLSGLGLIAVLASACGGQVNDHDNGTVNATTVTGNWTEPRFYAGWSDLQGDTNCGDTSHVDNAQLHITVAGGCGGAPPSICGHIDDPHHVHIVSIEDYVPGAHEDWRGYASGLGWSHGWVEIISNFNKSISLWPNPGHPDLGGYETACALNQGDWCMRHGSSAKPLYDPLLDHDIFWGINEHPVRVVHHEGVDLRDCSTSWSTSWRHCNYDLTDWNSGTWTMTGCYTG